MRNTVVPGALSLTRRRCTGAPSIAVVSRWVGCRTARRHPDRSAQPVPVIPTLATDGLIVRCAVEGPPHFSVACFCSSFGRSLHTSSFWRSQNLRIRPCRCLFYAVHPASTHRQLLTEKNRRRTPQKPQQIRMSSPSTPKNPANSRPINHFTPKNSWHTSYAPVDTINIWIKSIEGQLIPRGNKLPPPT